ncbi:MAG: divergent PAP2 family protein [Lachnospiraceae bacterium]
MNMLQILLHNKMFMSPLLGWGVAQILKTIINFAMTKQFNPERLFGSGGMPSSHSATVCGLVYATAYCKGFGGYEFPMALTFAFIVMYDAMNVRMETGKQAVILNNFLKNENLMNSLKGANAIDKPGIILKEYVGHTPVQVFAGMCLGLFIGYLVCRFL